MTTIVLNTANGAVTEYDWTLSSLAPGRATSSDGLLRLGGPTDAGAPIAATFLQGRTLTQSLLRKAMGIVFVAMQGAAGTGSLRVRGSAEWTYPFTINPKGVSRIPTGRGIDDNYLALGFANVAGGDFAIDEIDAQKPESKTRRT